MTGHRNGNQELSIVMRIFLVCYYEFVSCDIAKIDSAFVFFQPLPPLVGVGKGLVGIASEQFLRCLAMFPG